MRCFTLLLVLMLQQTSWAELHYFTDLNCAPCKKVSPIVDLMNRQGRDIKVNVWQDDQAPFKKYDVDWLPQFVEIVDGKVQKRWRQDAAADFWFTSSFVSSIAPFREKTQKPIPQPTDCARPAFPLAIKNLIPPPPAPGLPNDIPDRVKVKRIEDLEALVNRQQGTINKLRESLSDLERAINSIAITAKGEPGRPGLNGSDGADGRQGPAGPPGPAGRLDAATLAVIQTLRAEVTALKNVNRRFLVVTGNDKDGHEILSDLDYEVGETVVLNRDVFIVED